MKVAASAEADAALAIQRAYLAANKGELTNMIKLLGYPTKGQAENEERIAAQHAYKAISSPAQRMNFLQQFIAKGPKDLRWAATFSQATVTTDRTSYASEENYMTRFIYIYIVYV